MDRRQFLSSLLAISSSASAAALVRPATLWAASRKSSDSPKSLDPIDPIDPHIRYGITGSLWGEWPDGNLKMSTDLHQIVSDAARFGLQGIEPYSSQVVQFLAQPLALKQICNAAGITLIDVGDLPLAPRSPAPGAAPAHPETAAGGPNPQPNPLPNPWIDKEGNAQLIADMVSFARDFLAPCGCDHWKTNMGRRPEGGPSEDQLKRLAATLNEIGRQTIAFGVRLAPHPHIWGPMEREHEVRTVLALTDPKYVWLTPDTAHLTLGGMDAVKIVGDYFPRIAEVHLKDTYPRYRGNSATPTQAEHHQASLYHNLGAGGVDFPAIFRILRERCFRGWVVLDLDAPRSGDGTGSIQQNLAANIEYLRDKVGIRFPKAAA
jgi:sugar phosphate isomerase/epimerase